MIDPTQRPFLAPSIAAVRAAIAEGLDPQSLITPLWERARALEPKLRAFAHLPGEAPEASTSGPLAGVAVGIKDLIDTADMPTVCGSPILAGRRPEKDAEIVARLRSLGATALGKTVTTEFAWRDAGPTRNPWSLEHTPGGSSSGSAAAVAAGIVTLALGTQTFGSVIRPAAFCGVVGFKPSFGVLPRAGVQPLSPSLDHVGLFARTVEDIAETYRLLAVEAGREPAPVRATGTLRLALLAPSGVDADQETAFASARRRLADAGATMEVVQPPGFPDRLQKVADILVAREAAAELWALQRSAPAKMSPALSELVATGRAISAAQYSDAIEAQAELRGALTRTFAGFDAILTVPAPGGAPHGLASTGDARFCTPWTVLGFPAITLPVGLSEVGLPIGLQLAGRFGEDRSLISAAASIARVIGYSARPTISP